MTNTGSTTNGGVNAYTNSFTLAVYWINQPPFMGGYTNISIWENAQTNTSTVTVYDVDSPGTNLTLTVSSANTNIVGVSITTSNTPGATNASFVLGFSSGTNAIGSSVISLVASDGTNFTTNTFTATVVARNQPPSYTFSTNTLVVGENAGNFSSANFLTSLASGPTNQAAEGWGFFVLGSGTNATNVSFAVAPTVSSNGTLSFRTTTNTFGTNTLTVVMTNTGSLTNGGINAYTNSFTLAVYWINQPPFMGGYTNISIWENAQTNTSTVTVYDVDSPGTNLSLSVSSANTNMVGVSITTSNTPGATNASFVLGFSPGTNAIGSSVISLVASDGTNFTTNTFTATIVARNQPPSYTFSTNTLVVGENAGLVSSTNFLTNLASGPTNQAAEGWSFTVTCTTTNSTNVTFAVAPTISSNGTLSFQTTTNTYGTNTVTVVMTNTGGTANGGINSYSNSFTLAVYWIKYPPSLVGLTNTTILENATNGLTIPFTIVDLDSNIFTLTATSSATNVTGVSATSTNKAGTLTLIPVTNAYGTSTITVSVDDGYTTNNSNSATFTLTVLMVNQAPSFSLSQTNVAVDNYLKPITMTGFLTNISAGQAQDTNLSVNFIVTNNSPALFAAQPAIDTNGTLTFTPQANAGTITVSVSAHNNGGVANGGSDTSAIQTFTITIPPNPFDFLQGQFAGLFFDTNTTANSSSGYFSLALATNGNFSGYVLVAGASNTFSGQFDATNATASTTLSNANLVLNLALDISANWTESISGSVSNTADNWNATLLSYLNVYSATFPSDFAAEYLVAIPGGADSQGPDGDGTLSLVVSNTGTASLGGYLGDNTQIAQESQISRYGHFPFYVGFGSTGSISGWLSLTNDQPSCFTPDSQVAWIKESGGASYTGGFTNVSVAIGSAYNSTVRDLLSINTAQVILTGGGLATPITNDVTIAANTIIVASGATNDLVLTMDRTTGQIQGSFSAGGQVEAVYSVILQSTNEARGYFWGNSESGSFILK
jgi:hypothetical protein